MTNLHHATVFSSYIGRFAPSPTGLLHAGSLVAAMASYLDARAHNGRWLIRIEDVDTTRTVAGAAQSIIQTLQAFGMHPDGEVVHQSNREPLYAAALHELGNQVYECGCSRREIADSISGSAQSEINSHSHPYSGTCRNGKVPDKNVYAWRVRVPEAGESEDCITFADRACGVVTQYLSSDAGDFVVRRADGFWAYQLAVVVDDAAQGITDVVRGMDLLESTPRQIYLQRKLGLATPRYLHVPVVVDPDGRKLSKHHNSTPLENISIAEQLHIAANALGLAIEPGQSQSTFWTQATLAWKNRYLS